MSFPYSDVMERLFKKKVEDCIKKSHDYKSWVRCMEHYDAEYDVFRNTIHRLPEKVDVQNIIDSVDFNLIWINMVDNIPHTIISKEIDRFKKQFPDATTKQDQSKTDEKQILNKIDELDKEISQLEKSRDEIKPIYIKQLGKLNFRINENQLLTTSLSEESERKIKEFNDKINELTNIRNIYQTKYYNTVHLDPIEVQQYKDALSNLERINFDRKKKNIIELKNYFNQLEGKLIDIKKEIIAKDEEIRKYKHDMRRTRNSFTGHFSSYRRYYTMNHPLEEKRNKLQNEMLDINRTITKEQKEIVENRQKIKKLRDQIKLVDRNPENLDF